MKKLLKTSKVIEFYCERSFDIFLKLSIVSEFLKVRLYHYPNIEPSNKAVRPTREDNIDVVHPDDESVDVEEYGKNNPTHSDYVRESEDTPTVYGASSHLVLKKASISIPRMTIMI